MQTGDYNANPGDFVPVDTTSGSRRGRRMHPSRRPYMLTSGALALTLSLPAAHRRRRGRHRVAHARAWPRSDSAFTFGIVAVADVLCLGASLI